MNQEMIIDLGREAISTLLQVGMPLMLISLCVGLTVSLFQALTSIQEMTLTFVPKILVLFFSLLLLMPYMITKLSNFAESIFARIVSGG